MHRLAAVLLSFVLVACAAPQPQRSETTRPAISGNADADLLAAAALRSWGADRNPDQALALIERAAQAGKDRVDLLWLHLQLCAQVPGCESAPMESRLHELDPGNGVAWLSVLSRAQSRGDAQAAEQILDAMSRAERFDLYWTSLVWRLSSALNRQTAETQINPLTTALNDVVGWLSGIAIPAFRPITSACERKQAKTASAIARCRRIAEAMQRGDTTLAEALGMGIAQRLATPGSNEAAALDQRVATLRYQSQSAGRIMDEQVEREKFSAEIVELMQKLHREQEVSIAILRWAGEPIAPMR